MRASIIINNFNYGRFLNQAVESALDQTYPDIELIVVDDGSTDDSLIILESYGDRIRLVAKKNGGQASCYSAGFSHCTGDIAMFLDADDYLRADCIETVARHWREGTAKAHFRLTVVDSEGCPIGAAVPSGKLAGREAAKMMNLFGSYCSPPSSGNVFSAAFLKKILPFKNEADLIYSADSVLIFSAPFFGEVIAIDDTLAYYRRHASAGCSVTTIFDSESAIKNLRKEHEKDHRRDRSWRMACQQFAPARYHLMEPSRAKRRMCYLRLSGTGLEEGDTRPGLMRRSIGAVWHWDGYSLVQKIFATVWFALVAALPMFLCRRLIRPALGLAERKPLQRWILGKSGARRGFSPV